MKELPACQTDVVSGFLCPSCQKKLDAGDLTEFEIDLARDLLELESSDPEKYGYLKDVSFFKAIDFEDVVIMVVGNKDRIRIEQSLIKYLKQTYEIEELILIERTKKPRPVVDALIAPLKLLSLNEIFLATGEIEFRAVLRASDKDKILFTKDELEELIQELTGNITRVEYQ